MIIINVANYPYFHLDNKNQRTDYTQLIYTKTAVKP